MRYRDIALGSAFGAGIGTIFMIVLQQYTLLGVIGGACIGAAIGGLVFQPSEVWRIIRQAIRRRWRTFAWSTGIVAYFVGSVYLWTMQPTARFWVLATPIGVGAGLLISAFFDAALYVFGRLLAYVHCVMLIWIVGIAYMLGFFACTGVIPDMGELFGCSVSLMALMLFVSALTVKGIAQMGLSAQERWAWALLRRTTHIFGIDRIIEQDDAQASTEPLVPALWGSVRIDGRLFRPRAFIKLLKWTMEGIIAFGLLPLLTLGLLIVGFVDLPCTIILALASRARVAVMEGAFLGTCAGAAFAQTSGSAIPALIIGMVVGAGAGVGLYRVRKILDQPPATSVAM